MNSHPVQPTPHLYQQVLEQAAEAIFWMTWEGHLCYVNHQACQLLGYSKAELLTLKIHDIDPDMPAIVWQEHRQDVKSKGSLKYESRHQTKSGDIFPVEVMVNYLEVNSSTDELIIKQLGLNYQAEERDNLYQENSGNFPLLCGFVRDISERKSTSSAITESKDQLAAVLNALPGLVSWISSDLKYLGVNHHLANAYDVPSHEFVGKEIGFLETSPEFNNFVYEFFASENWTDAREVKSNVKEVPRTYLIVAQKYHRGAAAVFVGLDITKRLNIEVALRESEEQEARRCQELEETLHQLKRTQSQLIQTEKMSTLGQLVAGIAHEINNPVSFISGNLSHAKNYIHDLMKLVELYQQYYPLPVPEIEAEIEEISLGFLKQDLPKMLESMKSGSERIRDVVRSLRYFSRLDESKMKFIDLHEGLDSTLLILQNRLQVKVGRSSITLVKEYGNLPQVECYAGHLNQVFMNLLTFMIDRLETASTGEDLRQNPKIWIRTAVRDQQIVTISMIDNGLGLPESERNSIFEPFPKVPIMGKGTGLGLSIAHHLIVEEHGGKLQCFSELGQGTEFLIQLPIQNSAAKMPATDINSL